MRHRRTMAVSFGQTPVIGLLIAVLFDRGAFTADGAAPQDAAQLLVLLLTGAIWLGITVACREVVVPLARMPAVAATLADATYARWAYAGLGGTIDLGDRFTRAPGSEASAGFGNGFFDDPPLTAAAALACLLRPDVPQPGRADAAVACPGRSRLIAHPRSESRTPAASGPSRKPSSRRAYSNR